MPTYKQMLHVLPVTAAADVFFSLPAPAQSGQGLCRNAVLARRLMSGSDEMHAFLQKLHASCAVQHAVARNATTQQLARNPHIPKISLKTAEIRGNVPQAAHIQEKTH